MAHTKIIRPSGWDFGQPIATMVKVSSRGLIGSDRTDFLKIASPVFADLIDRIKVAKDEMPVHLIALGASEYWGHNRNGDGFKEATCRKQHETFEKSARWYRNHCFVAGTQILMADRTRKPIEQIVVGDRVMTREGSKRVTALMRTPYSDAGVRIRLRGVPHPMTVTPEHPILVLRREQLHCKHRYSRLEHNEHGLVCHDWRNGLRDMVPVYVDAGAVRAGDYVLTPKPKHGRTVIEPYFAALVGWVASEGCLSDSGLIQFTFSAKNTADISAVTRCLKQNGMAVTTTPRPDTGCVMLSSCSRIMHAMLSQYVVGKLDTKALTGKVLEWDAASLYALLASFIDGDGHVAKGHNRGQLRIRSSSPAMLAVLSDVLRSLDIPVTVNHDCKSKPMVSPTNGETYQGRGSGVVAVDAHYSPQLLGKTRKCVLRVSKRRPASQVIDGCYLVRVNSVAPVAIDEPVYNFEVAGPHHYIANEVVVHNCNKDPAKSYGYVKKAAYHDAMHRIELLCMLNAEKSAADRNGGFVADKELKKLAAGEDPSVSMACRVPFDVCSGCDNKARTRDEYCTAQTCKYGGCKDNLTKVAEDGHQLGVDNPNAHFFDISDVFRPADRTAYGAFADYLQKAASADLWVPGAELADGLGVTAPLSVVMAQDAGCEWDPHLRAQIKLAYGLAMLEQQDDLMHPDAYRAFDANVQGQLSGDQFNLMGRPGTEKAAQALSALADNKVVLPLREFARWVSKEAAVAGASRLLTGVYGRLVGSGSLESQLLRNPFATTEKVASIQQLSMAKGLTASHSMDQNMVTDRTMRSSLRTPEAPISKNGFWNEKQAADAPEAASLAEQYALYKLAALCRIASFDHAFNLTARLAVGQNRVV